jgi:hypothetical protein
MGDTMHPIEHERPKDYFWFEPGRPLLDPLGKPIPGLVLRGEKESHPTLDYDAFIENDTLHGGNNLIIDLPFGRNAIFDLASFPTDRWENLVDDAGNQIPLRILVHGGRVAGQWVSDPGIVPPPPA